MTDTASDPTAGLAGIRTAIDAIDGEIVALLARREALVRQAAPLKADDAAVRAPARVEQVIARVRQLATEFGASPDAVERIYRGMIATYIDLESAERA